VILDSKGRKLKRSIGFIGGFMPVRKALPIADVLSVVGFEVPLEKDDEEEDAATVKRARRTQ
jgi:hypothetical protein